MGEEDSFALGCQSTCAEALGLYRMLSHDGNTIEAIRELIAIPLKIEQVLLAFARVHTEEAHSIEAEADFKDDKLQKLRENEYGYLFFLPADPATGFPASYADLSRITAVDGSYFRPDALLKRLSSRGMIELQNFLTDLYGRAIGFTVNDDVPQAAKYGCVCCFALGNPQIHESIATGGKFPNCRGCGAKALWIKLP